MRLTGTLCIGGQMLLFKFQNVRKPTTRTTGLSARIPHTLEYVIFMDYDNIKDRRLIDEQMAQQEYFHLGDSLVFATNEYGRHVICVDRLFFRDVREVINTSSCDYDFKKGYLINEYRTWILRCFEKGERDRPKYLYTVKSPYNGMRLQSQAHALFLKRHYGAKVRLTNPDGNYLLTFQDYKTSSKVRLKDVKQKK